MYCVIVIRNVSFFNFENDLDINKKPDFKFTFSLFTYRQILYINI